MVSFINTHFPFGVSLALLYRLRLIIQFADVTKLFLIKTVVKPLVSTTGSVKNLIEQADEIPFYSWGYGRAYTEGGEVTVLEDGYIDNCADGPDEDYYDRDELVSLIGDRYDAKYPVSSSKTADRSLGHKQEVSRNASELLNDGKQAIETSLQEH